MNIQTINSAKLTWKILPCASFSDCVETYCTDGDGLVSIHKRLSGVYYATCEFSEAPQGIFASLEEALAKGEALLLEFYPEVYENAMHWNDEPTTDELWLHIKSSRQTEGDWSSIPLHKTENGLDISDGIYEAAEVDHENGTEEEGTHYGQVLEAIEPILKRQVEFVKTTIDGINYEFSLSRCEEVYS